MVKFYSSNYSYDYPFSAVSLAYFLRYPNPYSKHVTSTDVISRTFDPITQRLTTIRLHVKRSRLPSAVVKLLPRSSTKSTAEDGSTQSFILEESIVDVKEGWMKTESRNLDWNNVLSVIERQTYRRPSTLLNATPAEIKLFKETGVVAQNSDATRQDENRTEVSVSVTLKSHIGEQIRKRRQRWGEQGGVMSAISARQTDEDEKGWFNSWTSGAVRSAIESISLQRTERSQPKAQKGMSVVLDRLRNGGIQAALEGMKDDCEIVL